LLAIYYDISSCLAEGLTQSGAARFGFSLFNSNWVNFEIRNIHPSKFWREELPWISEV
jgi:hypothetical protein